MGLSKSIIAIKGDYTNNLNEVNSIINYMEDYDLETIILKESSFKNGWTIIPDEEIVLIEDDLLQELSENLNTEVFAFIVQSTSATYGFYNFKGEESRSFLVQDGEVLADFGDKLDIEINMNINSNLFIDDIEKIAQHIGVDF